MSSDVSQPMGGCLPHSGWGFPPKLNWIHPSPLRCEYQGVSPARHTDDEGYHCHFSITSANGVRHGRPVRTRAAKCRVAQDNVVTNFNDWNFVEKSVVL